MCGGGGEAEWTERREKGVTVEGLTMERTKQGAGERGESPMVTERILTAAAA